MFKAFTAVQGNISPEVEWSVNSSNISTSIDENGLLTVSPNEAATTLTVTATSTADNTKFGTATVTVADAPILLTPPSIQTGSLPDGNVGTAYGEALTADGDEKIFWTIESGSLPAGFTLSQAGVISGTPTAKGTFAFTVEARNSAGADSKQFDIEIFTIYNIDFNANGGEVSPKSSTTNTDAQLDSLPTPTRANHSFKGWFTAISGGSAVTTTTVFTGEAMIYAQWTSTGGGTISSGTGGSTHIGNDAPEIEVGDAENGVIEVDNKNRKPGDTVNIGLKPDDGYEVGNITVRDEKGNELPVTRNGKDEYSFTYGGDRVFIEVSFIPLSNMVWNPFTDVRESDWFHDDVKYGWEKGLMVGVSNNMFAPQSGTTRAMVVTILWRLEGEPAPTAANPFSDVTAEAWYADAVIWATETGIVLGYGDGNFSTNDEITREQLSTMLYRYANWKGLDISAGKDAAPPFDDVSEISAYAIPAMRWVYARGLLKGRTATAIVPIGTATRAELAAILRRFLDNWV